MEFSENSFSAVSKLQQQVATGSQSSKQKQKVESGGDSRIDSFHLVSLRYVKRNEVFDKRNVASCFSGEARKDRRGATAGIKEV